MNSEERLEELVARNGRGMVVEYKDDKKVVLRFSNGRAKCSITIPAAKWDEPRMRRLWDAHTA